MRGSAPFDNPVVPPVYWSECGIFFLSGYSGKLLFAHHAPVRRKKIARQRVIRVHHLLHILHHEVNNACFSPPMRSPTSVMITVRMPVSPITFIKVMCKVGCDYDGHCAAIQTGVPFPGRIQGVGILPRSAPLSIAPKSWQLQTA